MEYRKFIFDNFTIRIVKYKYLIDGCQDVDGKTICDSIDITFGIKCIKNNKEHLFSTSYNVETRDLLDEDYCKLSFENRVEDILVICKKLQDISPIEGTYLTF